VHAPPRHAYRDINSSVLTHGIVTPRILDAASSLQAHKQMKRLDLSLRGPVCHGDLQIAGNSKREMKAMGIGVSILLIAVGAVLAYAVHVTTQGVDLQTIGVILMVVGIIGAVFSMLFWSTWGGVHRRPYPDDMP
jgi:hypothetical protein